MPLTLPLSVYLQYSFHVNIDTMYIQARLSGCPDDNIMDTSLGALVSCWFDQLQLRYPSEIHIWAEIPRATDWKVVPFAQEVLIRTVLAAVVLRDRLQLFVQDSVRRAFWGSPHGVWLQDIQILKQSAQVSSATMSAWLAQ